LVLFMDIEGLDIRPQMSVERLLTQLRGCGLQGSQIAKAADIIDEIKDDGATVFLTFTTNMVSSGLREVFAKLCKEKKVDVIITPIGSIEEDLMKSIAPFELASFEEDDNKLHEAGKNRVGNILISNKHYEELEKRLMPFFEKEFEKQKRIGRPIAPFELIRDLGEEIDDEGSFLYWASKNGIPIFCPAVTDGAFGFQLYFYKQKNPEFAIDASGDLKPLGQIVLDADKTAGIILGGGVAKHHAIGANLLREGFDYAIYVSTGTQYDGSLSGARTSEAVSWGKIKKGAKSVHVDCEATIAFSLLATRLFR
jgi:deoxyhypusine synthase